MLSLLQNIPDKLCTFNYFIDKIVMQYVFRSEIHCSFNTSFQNKVCNIDDSMHFKITYSFKCMSLYKCNLKFCLTYLVKYFEY